MQPTLKRKRQIHSCVECHRRKVKCDRQRPACQRCTDLDDPAIQCVYGEDVESKLVDSPNGSASTPLPSVLSDASETNQQLRSLQTRVAQLERALSVTSGTSQQVIPLPSILQAADGPVHEGTSSTADKRRPNIDLPPTLIRGRGFKTQFRGPSSPYGIQSWLPAVHEFQKKLSREHPALDRHRRAMRSLGPKALHPNASVDTATSLQETMRNLLPPESRCRELMTSYFLHFEHSNRILHSVSFWRSYNTFVANPDSPTSAPFIATLLAAMSSARCLLPDSPPSFDGIHATAATDAQTWLTAAESFHQTLSHKHSTLPFFQILCLALLAKRIMGIKIKRHFIATQTLVATAVSAGLHRDPKLLGGGTGTSFYECEMRRRLWATISEFDLATSICWGCPAYSAAIFSDCPPPSNLDDADFDQTTVGTPSRKPDEVYTACSYQRVLHKIRRLRGDVASLVNDPPRRATLTNVQLLAIHQQISQSLSRSSNWSADDMSPAQTSQAALLRLQFELHLHQLTLILHLSGPPLDPTLVNTSVSNPICLDSAIKIVQLYDSIPNLGFSRLCVVKPELIRAGFCIALLESPSIFGIESELQRASRNQWMERIFAQMEERIMCLGQNGGLDAYWLVYAACCLGAKSERSRSLTQSGEPAAEEAQGVWERNILDRVLALLGKINQGQISGTRQDQTIRNGSSSLHSFQAAALEPRLDLPSVPASAEGPLINGFTDQDWEEWLQDELCFAVA